MDQKTNSNLCPLSCVGYHLHGSKPVHLPQKQHGLESSFSVCVWLWRDIKRNKEKTGYSHHILNTGHAFGKLEDTLEILNLQRKGLHLNTLEKFHICKENKTGQLLNEVRTDQYNRLFELLI
jgi:hypothetical protein